MIMRYKFRNVQTSKSYYTTQQALLKYFTATGEYHEKNIPQLVIIDNRGMRIISLTDTNESMRTFSKMQKYRY